MADSILAYISGTRSFPNGGFVQEEIPQDIQILGWCPAGLVFPDGEKVPL